MERRHTRRLVRYWVFIGIVYVFGIGAFLYYSTLHALFSPLSASIGLVGPRYMIAVIGLYYLMAFVFTIVFLHLLRIRRPDDRPIAAAAIVTTAAWICLALMFGASIGSAGDPRVLIHVALSIALLLAALRGLRARGMTTLADGSPLSDNFRAQFYVKRTTDPTR